MRNSSEDLCNESNIESDKNDNENSQLPSASDDPNNDLAIESSETQGVRYGKCKWFNVAKGWGFITPNDGGQEVFVHQSVIQMPRFRSLAEQEEVEFECHKTERGLEATRVSGPEGTDCHGSTFHPRPKKTRRVRCYNCGEFDNHIAAKCHHGPLPQRCHSCKQNDHLFANCPNRKNKKKESAQHSSKDDESSVTSENKAEEDR